ncbi:PKD domain-containing protein [Psychroserpens sp. AS72]|uniref:PKD domain-containing protein n=1 Tax=Psychroserpens sp. AS72 TaxID=3135775 RepID=UPI003180727C
MKSNLFLFLFLLCNIHQSTSQDEKVLFIGNSYTFVENIPNMLYEVANSAGDVLIVEAETTGGGTFEHHATSQDVTNKINSDDWDFIVLQGQSIEVALTGLYFDFNVAPYAAQLIETIRDNNNCTQPIFYNTWGRKFGISGSLCTSYPWVCTYEGMDDELAQNYRILADTHDAVISPVGPVWRYLREHIFPVPIELYQIDNSHQSLEGAYASACTFYSIILRKDPTLITYNPGIDPVAAFHIRNAVKVVVYDQLDLWKVGEFDPISSFLYSENNGAVSFTNTSSNATNYAWDFGDGSTSTDENPMHTYSENGDYDVVFTVTACGVSHTYSETISVNSLSLNEHELSELKMFPNPAQNLISFSGFNFENIKSISLYDLLGKKLKINRNQNEMVIDISKLSIGSYFIEFIAKNGSKEIRRVIKK